MGMGCSAIRPWLHGKGGLGMSVSRFSGRGNAEGVFVAVVFDAVFLPFVKDYGLPFDDP